MYGWAESLQNIVNSLSWLKLFLYCQYVCSTTHDDGALVASTDTRYDHARCRDNCTDHQTLHSPVEDIQLTDLKPKGVYIYQNTWIKSGAYPSISTGCTLSHWGQRTHYIY